MIHWDGKDPAAVERAIKALLRQLYEGIEAIEGAGGDDAQDLRLRVDGTLTIFEVKSFSRALIPSQRRQVKKSLLKAVRLHSPQRWILILPHDKTPAETIWWTELQSAAPGVHLEWWGRDWLDGQFADKQELIAAVEGTDYQLLARAAQFGQETAVLAKGGTDLAERGRALMERAAELSLHWKYESRATDTSTILTLQRSTRERHRSTRSSSRRPSTSRTRTPRLS